MPDDLHDRDVLAWSEHQATLLRRTASGERVNDIDWAHVVEEIEGVGLSELHAVQSLLQQILVHLLKLHFWPQLGTARHWRGEIVAFQGDLHRRFAPSMRQRIDLPKLFLVAAVQVGKLQYAGRPAASAPEPCPVSIDELLHGSTEDIEAALAGR